MLSYTAWATAQVTRLGATASHFTVAQLALMVKKPHANAGDVRDAGSVPGSGRFPGGRHGRPLQCSCLGNPMDRGAWGAMAHGVAESDRTAVTQHACMHEPVNPLYLGFPGTK